jgi:hypothetical protein
MSSRRRQLHDEATVYHFQLARRIPIPLELKISYLLIAALFGTFQFGYYGTTGILSWMIGLIAVELVHFIIIRLTLIRVNEPEFRRFRWSLDAPWIGYVPVRHIELGLFRRLHRHALWFGLCVIAVAYPWVHESFMISLICWHLWTLAPRSIVLRKLRGIRRDSVLKLSPTDCSAYYR